MFPNVRLLIGTLFIALLVLSCEFGVFAALRVSREPLSRLTAESASLQLIAGRNAPAAIAMPWAAPVEHASEALAPSPAAAPMQQIPAPPAGNAAAAPNEPAPPQSIASAAPALGATTGAPAQNLAAAPPSLTAAPAQPTPDPQAHASVANAIALAPAAQPAEITGSIPNAATPDPAIPEGAVPLPKAAPKIAHKPANTVRKLARAPALARRVVNKRVVWQAGAPAAASSSQAAATFNNPAFQSAPQIQSPAKKRSATKKTATNNIFPDPFDTQFGAH